MKSYIPVSEATKIVAESFLKNAPKDICVGRKRKTTREIIASPFPAVPVTKKKLEGVGKEIAKFIKKSGERRFSIPSIPGRSLSLESCIMKHKKFSIRGLSQYRITDDQNLMRFDVWVS